MKNLLFGAAASVGVALGASPLVDSRNLDIETILNQAFGFQPFEFEINLGVPVLCAVSGVGDLDFQFTENNVDTDVAVVSVTDVSMSCNGAGGAINFATEELSFQVELTFTSVGDNIPSAVSENSGFCTGSFSSGITGFPAEQEAAFANGLCGQFTGLVTDLSQTLAGLSASIGERQNFLNFQQAEAPGAINNPSGFSNFNFLEDAQRLIGFADTLQNGIPVVVELRTLVQEIQAIREENANSENADFFAFVPQIERIIQLLSGQEDFVLSEQTLGIIAASDEFKAILAGDISAENIIGLLDVIFAQPAFAALLPVPFADIRDQVARVVEIAFNIFIGNGEGEIVPEVFRMLQNSTNTTDYYDDYYLDGNLLQILFQLGFGFVVEGIDTLFSLADGVTLGQVAEFFQANDIQLGNGGEIEAIFTLIPLETPLSDVPEAFGNIPVGLYVSQLQQGSVGQLLFVPMLRLQQPITLMGDATQFLAGIFFTVVNDLLGGVFIDTDQSFPFEYLGAFDYFAELLSLIPDIDPTIPLLLDGFVAEGSFAPLLSFISVEQADFGFAASASRIRIDIPIFFDIVTDILGIIVGASTIAPLSFGSEIEMITTFDVTIFGAPDILDVVSVHNVSEIPGFTFVSNLQPLLDYDFEDVKTVPDLFVITPFFLRCAVGSFGVAHLGQVSRVDSVTTLEGGFVFQGFLEDVLNGVAGLFEPLVATLVERGVAKSVSADPMFLVDVGTSCTDNPLFVPNNDDDGLFGPLGLEATIGAAVGALALILLVLFFVFSMGSGGDYDDEEVPDAKVAAPEATKDLEAAEKKAAMEDEL